MEICHYKERSNTVLKMWFSMLVVSVLFFSPSTLLMLIREVQIA